MDKSSSLIERKVVMIPKLVIETLTEVEVAVPTKHEFINGIYFPIEFKKGIKYIPSYKMITVPKLVQNGT